MPRYARNTFILAKLETTYKTDASPTGAANAVQVSNFSSTPLNASNVKRDLIRGFFGGSEELVGTAYQELTFDVELAGSGAAGTAPAWGPLLRACGLAETVTASTRVDYTPVSTAFESLTIYYHDDGVLHKLLGARGTVSFKLALGDRPMLSFRFMGLYSQVTATANPTPTLTAWKTPLVVTDANTADLMFGGTHSPSGAPAITGGTAIPSKGIEVDLGLSVNHTPLLGDESIDITQREVSGKVSLDLTAAQEVTAMADVLAATTTSIGLVHGTTAGNKVLLWLPSVQRINPKKSDLNGRRLIDFDLRCVPVSGNDEARLVVF